MIDQVIEQVVLAKVQSGEPFTVYEITKEVRKEVGAGLNVRHDDVREAVQNRFFAGNLGGYIRTIASIPDLPAGELQPQVYHNPGADLSRYGLNAPIFSPAAVLLPPTIPVLPPPVQDAQVANPGIVPTGLLGKIKRLFGG